MTPQFVHGLASVIYKQTKTAIADLNAFSKHAKRQQINVDDVLLLARRNPDLRRKLEAAVGDQKEKKRGKAA
ncbi:hypothetical protein HDU96_004729 [Phlyctochytrium bullatum]|nr:hypothetical protein HDU96_004729 [Phlyctochytrium bullatum]